MKTVVLAILMLIVSGCAVSAPSVPRTAFVYASDFHVSAKPSHILDHALLTANKLNLEFKVIEQGGGLIRFENEALNWSELDRYCIYPYVSASTGHSWDTFTNWNLRSLRAGSGQVMGAITITLQVTEDSRTGGSNINVKSAATSGNNRENQPCSSTGVLEEKIIDDIRLHSELESKSDRSSPTRSSRPDSVNSLEEKYSAALASNLSNSTAKWRTSSDTDPITDVVIVRLSLTAETGTSKLGEPITLHLRCDDGRVDVYINWNDYMTDSALVTTRVDKNTPQTKMWGSDTSKTASFYPTTQFDARQFVKELVTGTKLVARATPYNEVPITAIWDLSGVVAATEELRVACEF